MRKARSHHQSGQILVIILVMIACAAVSTAAILGLILINEGNAGGSPPATQQANSPTRPGDADDPAPEEEEMTPEQREAYIIEWIDSVGGHPDDPHLIKTGALGASDVLLQSLDPQEVVDLLEVGEEVATKHADKPRLLFALGRAAWAHGYDRVGRGMLQKAAERGSAAAVAYLGYDALESEDYPRAITLLQQAIKQGFDSQGAKVALAELMTLDGQGGVTPDNPPPFRLEDFGRPDIIKAFYEGKAPTGVSELELWTYITSFLQGLSDPSNLFMVTDARKFYMELDPALMATANYAMMTSPKVYQEAMKLGMQSMAGVLQGLGTLGKGQSFAQSFAKMNKSMITPQARVTFMRLTGEHDGRRMSLSYDYHGPQFRQIYAGIQKYVKSRFK